MFGQDPAISETLEWMLQSRQVGDEMLVKTLVHEQFSNCRRFVSSIIGSNDAQRVEHITERVISRAARDAASYRGKMEVQTWLFKKSIAVIREKFGTLGKDSKGSINRFSRLGKEEYSKGMLDWYSGLTSEMCITITLFYLFEFNPSQIATVMDVPEDQVTAILEDSREKYSVSKNISGEVGDFEIDIQRILNECWPAVELNERDEGQITERILDELLAKDQRKRRRVLLGEALLAILAVFFVAGMGSLIDKFTPEPTTEVVYETRMVNEIVYILPTPGPTLPPTPFPEKAILYQAVGGETLAEIAEKIYFNSLILERLNNIPSDQPLQAGQQVMIGVSDSRVLMPTSVSSEVTPEPIDSTPDALTIDSDDAAIKQRIVNSTNYWQTIWADALVIQYGPPGYVGDPEFRRQQIWIDQPYFHYLLDGLNGGEVQYAYSVIGGWENLLIIQTGELLSNVGPQNSIFQPELQQILFNTQFQENFPGEIQVVGEDQVAERDVLVLDWYPEDAPQPDSGEVREGERIRRGRLWIDKFTGILLRVQEFSGNTALHIFKETIISRIIFDVRIPRRLYDRSQYLQTYFARNHTGDFALDHIPIPDHVEGNKNILEGNQYQSPPEDFTVSECQLDIHWTSLSRFNPEQGTTVDLFGDGYYLGNVRFSEPEQLKCARSPDGIMIAFSSWSNEINFGYTPLGWINLTTIPVVQFLNPGLIPYDFAFSPDSQLLAVYACRRSGDQACGIYLVELDSGKTRLFKKVEQGAELIWSPDGSAIAIQGSFLRKGKWRVLVFDIQSSNVIYDGPFDWEGFWVAHDSPIHKWGVPYPPLRGGLEVCAQPPNTD